MLPPEVASLVSQRRVTQQELARRLVGELGRLWSLLDGAAPLASWLSQAAPSALRAATAAQAALVGTADAFVAASVRAQGGRPDVAGRVNPAGLVGFASDGAALGDLLAIPAGIAQTRLESGAPVADALGVGWTSLSRIAVTQVQDAARVSAGVAMVADRSVQGYVRVVAPPSCSRCVILAGRWYRYNAGFDRHPHCDCGQAPATREIQPQSPRALYDAMTPAERSRAGWSVADQRALADGADMSQVVNARRDLRSVQIAGRRLQTTRVGTTRHGLAGQRLGATRGKRAIRLTPESIYAVSEAEGWSRDQLIDALHRNGYIL